MVEIASYLQFVLLPQILNGLSVGIALVLVALGLTVIFGLLDVVNMAHGGFYALGAYLSMTLYMLGLNYWWALLIVPIVMVPVGLGLERGLIRYVYARRDRHMLTLMLTLGLAIMLEDGLSAIYGPNTMRPASPIHGGMAIFGIFFPNYRIFLILAGTAVIVVTWYVLFRTSAGSMIRAAVADRDMAASLGVPVRTVFAITFGAGIALAGLAGVMLAPIYSVFPTMGSDFLLLAFTAVIFGGLGSFTGAVVAGLLLAEIQAVLSLFISPDWTTPLLFAIMVLTITVRPQGLFGYSVRQA